MHFKRMVSLFIFVSCISGINPGYTMDFKQVLQSATKGNGQLIKEMVDDVGDLLNEGMAVGKKGAIYAQIFGKHFKKRDLDKCVAAFMVADKFAKENNLEDAGIEIFNEFRISEKDDAFFKEIIQKVNAIEKKKKAERAKKNAKKKKNKEYAVDAYGRTELHNLVRFGNLKGVQAVLASNCTAAYFNTRSGPRKIHVLHYAADRAYSENGFAIAKLLIEYARSQNYDLNVSTLNGNTPLGIAHERGYKALVDLLAHNGASIINLN